MTYVLPSGFFWGAGQVGGGYSLLMEMDTVCCCKVISFSLLRLSFVCFWRVFTPTPTFLDNFMVFKNIIVFIEGRTYIVFSLVLAATWTLFILLWCFHWHSNLKQSFSFYIFILFALIICFYSKIQSCMCLYFVSPPL